MKVIARFAGSVSSRSYRIQDGCTFGIIIICSLKSDARCITKNERRGPEKLIGEDT